MSWVDEIDLVDLERVEDRRRTSPAWVFLS